MWFCFVIGFLIFSAVSANGQGVGSFYLEDSPLGVQQGIAIQYSFNKWSPGIFFQSSFLDAGPSASEFTFPGRYPFFGVYTGYRFIKRDKLSLTVQLKSGLVNNQYFVVMPLLFSHIKLHELFKAFFAISYRVRQPAILIGVSMPLFSRGLENGSHR